MWSWVWFGMVWLGMLGGFIAGSAWTGYMKSFALVPDDDDEISDKLRAQSNGHARQYVPDATQQWSGNWDGDIR